VGRSTFVEVDMSGGMINAAFEVVNSIVEIIAITAA
jgi:hypothetical protein